MRRACCAGADGLSGLKVRDATLADSTAIASLSEQLGPAPSTVAVESTLREILASPGHRALVAEDASGRTVGWVQIFRKALLQTGPYAEISGLVVDAAHRRTGVGRALLAAAEDWCRSNSLRSIRVRTNTLREDAAAFYAAAGFDLQKTQRVFSKELK